MLEATAARLSAGQSEVTIRPRGSSMVPLIMSGQEVAVRRVRSTDVLKTGMIVLVRVAGRVYLHKIVAIDYGRRRVQIGNNRGGINGWTAYEKVYGICRPGGDTPAPG
jgi:hypothetical protein